MIASSPARSAPTAPQSAAVDLRTSRGARIAAGVRVTPVGPLAIGGLVAAILWSVPPIIRAAGEARRG